MRRERPGVSGPASKCDPHASSGHVCVAGGRLHCFIEDMNMHSRLAVLVSVHSTTASTCIFPQELGPNFFLKESLAWAFAPSVRVDISFFFVEISQLRHQTKPSSFTHSLCTPPRCTTPRRYAAYTHPPLTRISSMSGLGVRA